ncbi:hypothetical protein [Flavobacterium sp. TBRC 19031]|uniref:hypothetical protein n=1 Tax=Flavobacterium mekongense TaxID=3379707 RepID=UPI00399A9EA4
MLSILFFYFVWKKFSELAISYGKSKHNGWFGILAYVGGLFFIGMILGVLNELLGWGIDFENNLVIRFMDIPVGLLCCYILYLILDKKWKSEVVEIESIDNIGASIDDVE